MLLKDCIYCIMILLCLFSIISLIYSIKSKDKYICQNIIRIELLYIAYLFISFVTLILLRIPIGMEIILIIPFLLIAGIIYITSIFIKLRKLKRLETTTKKKNIMIITMVMLILPIAFLSINVIRNKILINNSDLILVYTSKGNGGFGDYKEFAYAIGKNSCKEFDLGIAVDGTYLKRFLPSGAIEFNNINNISNYTITFNDSWEDNSISVHKDNEQICKTKNKSHYFNIEFERGFYINN